MAGSELTGLGLWWIPPRQNQLAAGLVDRQDIDQWKNSYTF